MSLQKYLKYYKNCFKNYVSTNTLSLQELCCIFLEIITRQSRIMLKQNGLKVNLSSKSNRDFRGLSGGKMKKRKEEPVELLFCLSRLKHILYSNRHNFKRHLLSWKHKILLSYIAWSPFQTVIIGA